MSARFARRRLRLYGWLVALVLFFAIRMAVTLLTPAPPAALAEGVYQVQRVVDGDTLLLVGDMRVRLQGIDAPETVKPDHPVEPWGPEASEFTRRFVAESDHQLRLTFGPERLDAYGRHLAFAWHGDRLLNEELVRAGLARARLDYRYSGTMKRRLRLAEQEAQHAGVGIWSPSDVAGMVMPAAGE